jgi:hypothetical protein
VAVLELEPSALYAELRPLFERMALGDRGTTGSLELEELGSSSTRVSATVLQELLAQGVPLHDHPKDLEPMRGLIRDCVAFHTDMPLWSDILGAWCLHGPERVLHFPMMGLSVPFRPGTFVLLDPAQPHGLLRRGQAEFKASTCENPQNIAMLSVSFRKRGALAELLGCESVPTDESDLLITEDQYTADRNTGRVRLLVPDMA